MRNSEYQAYRADILRYAKNLPPMTQDDENKDFTLDDKTNVLEYLSRTDINEFNCNNFENLIIDLWRWCEYLGIPLDEKYINKASKIKESEDIDDPKKPRNYIIFKTQVENLINVAYEYKDILSTIQTNRRLHKSRKKDWDPAKYDENTNLSQLKDYEKVFYTMTKLIRGTQKSTLAYVPRPSMLDNVIVFAKGTLDNKSPDFDRILKGVTKYYCKYMRADYIQINNELYSLPKRQSGKLNDPLGVGDTEGLQKLRQYNSDNISSIEYELSFMTRNKNPKFDNDVNDSFEHLDEDNDEDKDFGTTNVLIFYVRTNVIPPSYSTSRKKNSNNHITFDFRDIRRRSVKLLPKLTNVKDLKDDKEENSVDKNK